jgi:Ca2+-binding RTX toxin-like protein
VQKFSSKPASREFVQALEARKLMSFTPIGREGLLPINGGFQAYDVAVAGDGRAWVAHVSSVRSPSLGRDVNVLSVQRYDTMGRPAGTPTVLTRYAQPNAGVAIDANASGQVAIAYVERRGAFETLIVRRIDTIGLGEAADPGLRVFEKAADAQNPNQSTLGEVAVSINDAGGYFVAHRGTDSNDLQVQYLSGVNDKQPDVIAAFDDTGTLVDNTLDDFDIAARPDGSGAVFVAATSARVNYDITYGTISTTAKTGTDRRLPTLDVGEPSVAVTKNGGFVVAYTANVNGENYPGARTPLAQRFDAGGTAVGDANELRLGVPRDSDSPFDAASPDVVALADGGFAVSFATYTQSVVGSTTGGPTYARRYAADGTPDESGAVAVGSGSFATTSIASDTYGNVLVGYAKPGADNQIVRPTTFGLRRVTSGIIAHRREVYAVGTNGNDAIRIDTASSVDNRVRVTVNGQTRRFPLGYFGAISVAGLAGNDRVDVQYPTFATISGGAGNDTILGSQASDDIRGDAGNDRLYGNGGIDTVDGGGNSDFLRGGSSDDTLIGGPGNDRLFGDAGDDRFNGGGGSDYIAGGPGTDTSRRDDADILESIERSM